jgi:NAD(P)-dependent dehydrogenase (short-subunit alcohol dehydrogenase family)
MSLPEGPALSNRTAIVTGGASGIGRAIAVLFAKHGARVAILDLVPGDTAQQIEADGGTAVHVDCDVTRQSSVSDAFSAVHDRLGALDILVNSAGIAAIGTVEQTEEADFDRVYGVNVKGVYNCLRAGVAAMRGRGGAILNIASVASVVGIPDRFAYSMSKGAVLTMTRSIAVDYMNQRIRCNCICPARVHTPFVDNYVARNYPGREREMFAQLSVYQPIGRMGTPEEVAALALYLCSDEASFVTGQAYPIDGGVLVA